MDDFELEELLARVPLFLDLDAAERRAVRDLLKPVSFTSGQIVFRQGDAPDGLYIVATGRVELRTRVPGDEEMVLVTLSPGQILGEMALVDRQGRSASARVVEPLEAYVLDTRGFESLRVRAQPAAFKVLFRLALLLCGRLRATNEDIVEIVSPRSSELEPGPAVEAYADRVRVTAATAEIVPVLRILPFFRSFVDEELRALVPRLRHVEIPRGEILFREGDSTSSCYFTVRGAVEVIVRRKGRKHRLAVVGPGKTIGQVAFLDGGRRSATCSIRENAILLELERATFDRIADEHPEIAFRILDATNEMLISALRSADRKLTQLATQG